MTIAGKTPLATGANRGIGHVLVQEALRLDASLAEAGARRAAR
jgi:NAD(P)-dependent dehydrogenase (short-subunit alcohol dehydrogenase family)